MNKQYRKKNSFSSEKNKKIHNKILRTLKKIIK